MRVCDADTYAERSPLFISLTPTHATVLYMCPCIESTFSNCSFHPSITIQNDLNIDKIIMVNKCSPCMM